VSRINNLQFSIEPLAPLVKVRDKWLSLNEMHWSIGGMEYWSVDLNKREE